MAYIDLYKELETAVPGLPSMHAQKLVQRAWADIRKMRAWSFLYSRCELSVPQQITAGSVQVSFNSPVVVFNPAAQAAILPTLITNPPFAGGLGMGYQFRTTGGPIYTLTSYDILTGTATLDRPYLSRPLPASQTYQCYKCYYSLPSPVPRRIYSLSNLTSGYSISNRTLLQPQSYLDSTDPQRLQQGDSNCVSPFMMDSGGSTVMELYPHPTTQAVYSCSYRHGGYDLSQLQGLPPDFDDSPVMALAYLYAGKWAQMNMGNFPQLQTTNWVSLAQQQAKDFRDILIQAIKDDDEKLTQLPFFQQIRSRPGLGGGYLQSHDVSSLVGGY